MSLVNICAMLALYGGTVGKESGVKIGLDCVLCGRVALCKNLDDVAKLPS